MFSFLKTHFGAFDIPMYLAELEECIPDQTASVEQMADAEIITKTLNAFLAGLSQTHRKIFLRRYWFISGIDEIADDYGLSASNVKSILFRSRKKLRKNLEKEGLSL